MIHVAPILRPEMDVRGSDADWRLRRSIETARRPRQSHEISIRTARDIRGIAAAGDVAAHAIAAGAEVCVSDATTRDVDAACRKVILDSGAESLFVDYPSYAPGEGFPGFTCVSVNEEVVHAVPGDRKIREGDIVTIDCGVRLNGWCADAARTILVGRVRPTIARMVHTAEFILAEAIAGIRPGLKWSRIASRMQRAAEEAGYGVVREFVGHGIGKLMHEPPQIPAFVTSAFLASADFTLRPGMVLAVEPMLTLGNPSTGILADGWTVVTLDGEPACHVEHTVAVTQDGCFVLTQAGAALRPAAAALQY